MFTRARFIVRFVIAYSIQHGRSCIKHYEKLQKKFLNEECWQSIDPLSVYLKIACWHQNVVPLRNYLWFRVFNKWFHMFVQCPTHHFHFQLKIYKFTILNTMRSIKASFIFAGISGMFPKQSVYEKQLFFNIFSLLWVFLPCPLYSQRGFQSAALFPLLPMYTDSCLRHF